MEINEAIITLCKLKLEMLYGDVNDCVPPMNTEAQLLYKNALADIDHAIHKLELAQKANTP